MKKIIGLMLIAAFAAACQKTENANNSNAVNSGSQANTAVMNAEDEQKKKEILEQANKLQKDNEELRKQIEAARPELENLNKQINKTKREIEETNKRIEKQKRELNP